MKFKLSDIVYINNVLTLEGINTEDDSFEDLVKWNILSIDNEELVLFLSNMVYRFPFTSNAITIEYYKCPFYGWNANKLDHRCLEAVYGREQGKLFIDLLGDEFNNFKPNLQEYTAFVNSISRVFHVTEISISSRLKLSILENTNE